MVVADGSCEGTQDQTLLLKKFILPLCCLQLVIQSGFPFFLKKKKEKRQEVKTQLEILLFFLLQLNTRLITAGMLTLVNFR